MKSNLFQVYTNPDYKIEEYEKTIRYEFRYSAESTYNEDEDIEILKVDDYENVQDDLPYSDEEEE